MLSTRQGSIDWAGLDLVATLLGVQDVENLVRHLMVIKHHRKPE